MTDWGSARAIETRYAGVRFRSRLEARWAVFMDALGVHWEYEPEGFDFGTIRYLPDFWLPDNGCWLEVKPEIRALPVEQIEPIIERCALLAAQTRRPVVLLPGSPDAERLYEEGGSVAFVHRAGEAAERWPDAAMLRPCDWAVCLLCGTAAVADGPGELPLPCGHAAPGTDQRLVEAFETARGHRFWEGSR